MDLLWRDFEPDAARAGLRVALSSLRHQLEPPGVHPGSVIAADTQNVRLAREGVTTDLSEFEAAIADSHQCATDEERAGALSRAVSLYRGDLLVGVYEDWIPQQVLRLREMYVDSVLRLVALFEARFRHVEALELAMTASAIDPTDEAMALAVMRLMVALGQPAAAYRHYVRLRQTLVEEMGTVPSVEVAQMAAGLPQMDSASNAGMGSPLHVATPSALPEVPFVSGIATILSASHMQEHQDDGVTALSVMRRHGGTGVESDLGGVSAAFEHPLDALDCAVELGRSVGIPGTVALYSGDVGDRGAGLATVRARAAAIAASGHPGQMLCAEATASLLRPDLLNGVRLRLLGAYRFPGIAEPQRVFEVHDPATAASDRPPLNARAERASRVPVALNRFFGRQNEIARLRALVQDPEARLITLIGPPGCGKTRLAMEVARSLTPDIAGDVWFVPLLPVADAERIPSTVAGVMGVAMQGSTPPLDALCEALVGPDSLLILDNFEHLADDGAPIVAALLEQVPNLTCMVTSRRRLGVTGERQIPVAPLPVPEGDGRSEIEDLLLCPSVALFTDRAQAACPDFQLTSRTAPPVADICCRLEGVPLAIELVAARSKALSPARLVEALEQRFGEVMGHAGHASAGRRSALGAVEWSYELLRPELRRFLSGLSVFRGGWTVDAAEAVGQEPDALECLLELVDDSLVMAEVSGRGIRYRMLAMVREFAWAKLDPPDQAEFRRRHADHFAGVAAQLERARSTPGEPEMLDTVRPELENLRTALRWMETQGRPCQAWVDLILGLGRFWLLSGETSETARSLEALLSHDLHELPPMVQRNLFQRAGSAAGRLGDRRTSWRRHREALRIARGLGDPALTAVHLMSLGYDLQRKHPRWACRLLEGCLAISRDVGNPGWVSQALIALAEVTSSTDKDAAYAYLLEAHRVCPHPDDLAVRCQRLGYLANMCIERGRPLEGIPYLRDACATAQRMRSDRLLTEYLTDFALLGSTCGRYTEAARILGAYSVHARKHCRRDEWITEDSADDAVRLAREALGEAAFRQEWQVGALMSLDDASEYGARMTEEINTSLTQARADTHPTEDAAS